MGKTRRNCWGRYYRKVRGYKQARIARDSVGGIRSKAIPPNPWDDICVQKECWTINRAAENMVKQGWDIEKILHHLVRKFKVSYSEARESLPWGMFKNDDYSRKPY